VTVTSAGKARTRPSGAGRHLVARDRHHHDRAGALICLTQPPSALLATGVVILGGFRRRGRRRQAEAGVTMRAMMPRASLSSNDSNPRSRRLYQAVAKILVLVRRRWALAAWSMSFPTPSSSRACWRNSRRRQSIGHVQMRDQRRWWGGTGPHRQRRLRAYVAILRNIAKGSAPEP
jgi:hypothetical protein